MIVSNGGLLTRLDQPTMGRLLEAYYLVNLAETYRQQIVERSIGVASALATSGAVTQQYMAFLLKTIDTAEPKLNEIIALSKTRGA